MFTAHEEARIREAIAYECDRQHVGEDRRQFLFSAYVLACELFEDGQRIPTLEDALHLARIVEPDSLGRIRSTPVTFKNGGSSASPDTLPRVMEALFAAAPDFLGGEDDVRAWTKEFLWAHPLVDGNGRTAFVLYNWMLGTLRSPLMLPYFFGEA